MSIFERTGFQVFIIILLAIIGAGGTYAVKGAPDRSAVCDPAKIEEGEVCYADVEKNWTGKVLWVDARPRAEYDLWHMEGAVLINGDPNEKFDDLVAAAAEKMTAVENVVVYCGKEGCNASKEIAKKLREYQFGPKIYTLHGGVKALPGAKMP